MNFTYVEYNMSHTSIDINTCAGYILRIDCNVAENGSKRGPRKDASLEIRRKNILALFDDERSGLPPEITDDASWLNMIESFFSKMTKQMLKGIRVSSKEELPERIYQYFDEIIQILLFIIGHIKWMK